MGTRPAVVRCAPAGWLVRNTSPERGAALLEFALVSVVLYLLLAGAIEFGRLMFDANALQDAARLAARELAVAPVRADATFESALSCDPEAEAGCLVDLRRRVFDPACLVVDLDDPAVAADVDGYFAAMPVVNRALRALMITEPSRPSLLRYAGALLIDAGGAACSAIGPNGQAAPTGLTVGVPLVESRDAAGGESIRWVPVLEEIRAAQDAECPARGPFSLVYLANEDVCGALDADPLSDRGLAAVRVNYPYQAATLSGFRSPLPTPLDPLPPNVGNVIAADDGAVQETNAPPGITFDDGTVGPYAGPFGLGRQFALAGRTVRPFRRLISAQSIYRREVFE
jgi:TadE-like protein